MFSLEGKSKGGNDKKTTEGGGGGDSYGPTSHRNRVDKIHCLLLCIDFQNSLQ